MSSWIITRRKVFRRLRRSASKRFVGKVVALARQDRRLTAPFATLDIGCGAGAQCILWASHGDHVRGIDVNASLIEVARNRAAAAHLDIRFDVGSATALPYENASADVCLMPELLEHVVEWQHCVDESIRILRPGGILFLSTTNRLCPIQQEFNLPFYSWYPRPLQRHFERLAATTRPDLANYARYPAVHWFTYYGLARFLRQRGMACLDRFDMVEAGDLSTLRTILI